MKLSRTENRPWITSETKPGLNKKKIVEFHHGRRQNLVEGEKGSWFDQLLESEAASASFLDVLAVSKKKKH